MKLCSLWVVVALPCCSAWRTVGQWQGGSGLQPLEHERGASAPQKTRPPSIFCWAVSQPTRNEINLLLLQYRQNVSLFGCDEWAVYSNVSEAEYFSPMAPGELAEGKYPV